MALMLDERRGFLPRKQVQICREPPKGCAPLDPKEARPKARHSILSLLVPLTVKRSS